MSQSTTAIGSRRVIMRIELTERAKTRFEDMCARKGLTQVAAASRIMEWFGEQSDIVHAFILRFFPVTIVANVALMVLKRLAGSSRKAVASPAPAGPVVSKPDAKGRSIMRIQLNTTAKAAMEQYCQDAGMTQVSMMSILTLWFVGQHKSVQAAILGQYSPDLTVEVNALLKKKVVAELT